MFRVGENFKFFVPHRAPSFLLFWNFADSNSSTFSQFITEKIDSTMAAMASSDIYLLFGKNGWIGGKLQELFKAQGKTFYLADSRTESRDSVIAEIEKYKPTHVINAAGVTGRPNVDWCEDNRPETIRANVVGVLNVADICATRGIYHLLYATGCIFEYDAEHTIGGKGFLETDKANFHASFYSHTKVRS